MRAAWDELPTVVTTDERVRHASEWGGVLVARDRISVTGAVGRLDGPSCTCPHWGYLRTGRLRVHYRDHEELITEDDLYYLAPHHIVEVERDCDLVELSVADEWRRASAALGPGSGRCFVDVTGIGSAVPRNRTRGGDAS